MKRIISIVTALIYLAVTEILVYGEPNHQEQLSLTAQSAIVMEAETGKVLYEDRATEALPPASVTKVMTMLLIFEAIDSGKIGLNDPVTVSAHAASMGGSQVFLEVGEIQNVEVMIKSIAIASGNDAAVAMAEYIAGSEGDFVKMMNEKAKKLGMKQTVFKNCCGLDTDGHVTSAKDIAIMSRELIIKHPDVLKYTSIWMDEFTHKTRKGESVFGLSNTNKLLKQYDGCTGLKTGSTNKAKFCLSATAVRNDISLIAVVMASSSSKDRVKDTSALLDYGFANCKKYEVPNLNKRIKDIPVKYGEQDLVKIKQRGTFRTVLTGNQFPNEITYNIQRKKELEAPIKKGQHAGWITYYYKEDYIGKEELITENSVKKMTFLKNIQKIYEQYFISVQ